MAAIMKFDTLSWVKKLEKAGVPPHQAEVQAKLIFRTIDDNIFTKQDFRNFEENIKLEFKKVESKIEEAKKETMETKSRLELKIEGVRKEVVEVKKDLELKIENARNDLELKLEGVKNDLELKIEIVRKEMVEVKRDLELKIENVKTDLTVAIEKVKGCVNTQIAKWALGVAAIQTTILIVFMRSLH